MVNRSGLMYIVETIRDIGDHLSEEESIKKKAGYLLYNMVAMHPFLDGNKRTAFEVTKNFLRLNGWEFKTREQDVFGTLIAIASGEKNANDAELWVGKHLKREIRGDNCGEAGSY